MKAYVLVLTLLTLISLAALTVLIVISPDPVTLTYTRILACATVFNAYLLWRYV